MPPIIIIIIRSLSIVQIVSIILDGLTGILCTKNPPTTTFNTVGSPFTGTTTRILIICIILIDVTHRSHHESLGRYRTGCGRCLCRGTVVLQCRIVFFENIDIQLHPMGIIGMSVMDQIHLRMGIKTGIRQRRAFITGEYEFMSYIRQALIPGKGGGCTVVIIMA